MYISQGLDSTKSLHHVTARIYCGLLHVVRLIREATS